MISELPFKSTIPELEKIIDGMVKAGERILEVYETDFSTEKKDDDSPITQADIESNKILKEVLGETGITILSEEDVDDKKRLSEEKVWIVDPLDGTTNFLFSIPHFSITIALEKEGKIIAGIVYQPITDELFWAVNGKGAFCNNQRIRVSKRTNFSDCMIGTGIPHNGMTGHEDYIPGLKTIMSQVSGIRRMGAASLD